MANLTVRLFSLIPGIVATDTFLKLLLGTSLRLQEVTRHSTIVTPLTHEYIETPRGEGEAGICCETVEQTSGRALGRAPARTVDQADRVSNQYEPHQEGY